MRTLLLSLLLVSGSAFAADRPLDKAIASFEAHTGIDLHVTGDFKEPDLRMPADFGPVDPELALTVIPIIEDVLMEYPVEMRGGMLTDMYLYGKLTMRGKPFMGAAHPGMKSFDLAVRPRTTEASYRSTLHHELAHLIEGDEHFDEERWLNLSAPYSGRLDLEPESKDIPQDEWNQQGFVTRYASKNRHEDFAEMAEIAFTNPERLQALVKEHPKLKPKLQMMADVYQQYMPGMRLPWTLGADAVVGSNGRAVPGDENRVAGTRPAGDGVAVVDPPQAERTPVAAPPVTPRRRDDNGVRRPLVDDNGNPIR
jgi:hypothetical protein